MIKFIINEEIIETKGNRKYTTLTTITGETEKAVRFTQVKIREMNGKKNKTQRTEWFPKQVLNMNGNEIMITVDKFDCKGMFY